MKDIDIGASGLGFDRRPIKSDTVSPTAWHRCDIYFELCCPAHSRGCRLRFSYTIRRNTVNIVKIFFFL